MCWLDELVGRQTLQVGKQVVAEAQCLEHLTENWETGAQSHREQNGHKN